MHKSLLIEKLRAIGLSLNEARVYLASLEGNTSPVSAIAGTAGMNRVSTHSILKRLLSRGLVVMSQQDGVTCYSATAPELFVKDVQAKAIDLQKSLPLLKALTNNHRDQPTVRFFEGDTGVKQAYHETLVATTEILNYSNSRDLRTYWPEYDEEYVVKRSMQKIFLRGLAPDDSQGRKVQATDEKYYRETRLLDKKHFAAENEINIYDDKFFIASFEPSPFAIIIESQAVADTQRQIFEIAWSFSDKRVSFGINPH